MLLKISIFHDALPEPFLVFGFAALLDIIYHFLIKWQFLRNWNLPQIISIKVALKRTPLCSKRIEKTVENNFDSFCWAPKQGSARIVVINSARFSAQIPTLIAEKGRRASWLDIAVKLLFIIFLTLYIWHFVLSFPPFDSGRFYFATTDLSRLLENYIILFLFFSYSLALPIGWSNLGRILHG